MTDHSAAAVPVWTLATGDVQVPAVSEGVEITAERLGELRSTLASLADHPIATLEAHPLPQELDRSRGKAMDATSPLARYLSELIAQSAKNSRFVATATASGEGLYRMVIPAKVAAQVGRGIVRPMASKAASGGIYSALRDSTGVVANATFVPVGKAATAGAIGGAGATAGAVAGAAALTVAAPLVLMAVAVGMSAHADYRRDQAIGRITDLLQKLRDDELDKERVELNSCRSAIHNATTIVLDRGTLGLSLGLDSAVNIIEQSLVRADDRVGSWCRALDNIPERKPVDMGTLVESFPGIDDDNGVFRAHVELANLAIAMKRRVILVQAVEHAQFCPDSLFESFARALNADQRSLDELESGIASVLMRLSALELAPPRRRGLVKVGEVERLMRAAHRIYRLGDRVATQGRPAEVAIEIGRSRDGSLVVFPALPVRDHAHYVCALEA